MSGLPKKTNLDQGIQSQLLKQIKGWRIELLKLLPLLTQIDIVFNNRWLISATGSGGFALAKNRIALAYDPDFKGDKNKQLIDFKGAYFHETYHTLQGYTAQDTKDKHLTAIENAIYEGAATVFERDRAGTNPLWGKYEDMKTMLCWLDEVNGLPSKYDWQKYKFYDPKTNRRWILYKTGTFIVDETLKQNSKLKIEDLAVMPPREILSFSRLI